MIRTLICLYRLARFFERSREGMRAASITVVVEGESSASYAANCRDHEKHGLGKPKRRTAYEVTLWRDSGEAALGSETKRGNTLAEALGAALGG